jgi:hypothetical protein
MTNHENRPDALTSYDNLNYDYIHNVINHAEKYLEGNVHTNGTETLGRFSRVVLAVHTLASNRSTFPLFG